MIEQIANTDIKLIREAMGMTRREFAIHMEITVATVYLWEKVRDDGRETRIHPGNLSKLRKLKKKHIK